MLKITLTKGLVGTQEKQRRVIRALGLKKFGSSVEHADTPVIRGMIGKVGHLITVECCGSEKSESKAAAPKAKAAAPKPAARAAAKEPVAAGAKKTAKKAE